MAIEYLFWALQTLPVVGVLLGALLALLLVAIFVITETERD